MTILTLLTLNMMLSHLISDALLQSREEAQKKSEDVNVLLKHGGKNFLVTAAMLFLMLLTALVTGLVKGELSGGGFLILAGYALFKSVMPAFWNALIHMAIDWNIWRLYKRRAERIINEQADKIFHGDKPISAMARETDPVRWREACVETAKRGFRPLNDPYFFHTIMADQFLHYATIVFLVSLMTP
jgi:hypothetical protein